MEMENATGESSSIGRSHRGKKVLQCPRCIYRCWDSYQLKKHQSVHSNVRPFKCNLCNYAAKDKSVLQRHGKVHDDAKPYICTLCDYSAKRTDSLKKHMRTRHTAAMEREKMMESCKFDNCNFKSFYRSSLQKHIQRVHIQELVYKCHHCDYKTTTNSYLNRHISKKHISWDGRDYSHSQLFKCEICNFRTFQRSFLVKHRVARHLLDTVEDENSEDRDFDQKPYAQNSLQCQDNYQAYSLMHEGDDENNNNYHKPDEIYEEMMSHFYGNNFNPEVLLEANDTEVLVKCKHCDYVGDDVLVAAHNEDAHSIPVVVLQMFPEVS